MNPLKFVASNWYYGAGLVAVYLGYKYYKNRNHSVATNTQSGAGYSNGIRSYSTDNGLNSNNATVKTPAPIETQNVATVKTTPQKNDMGYNYNGTPSNVLGSMSGGN